MGVGAAPQCPIHCAQKDGLTPQAGAMNCAPTFSPTLSEVAVKQPGNRSNPAETFVEVFAGHLDQK